MSDIEKREDPKQDKTREEQEDSSPAELKQDTTEAKKHHKKHPVLKGLLIGFGLLFTLVILVAGWFGFVPGLSNIMGARTPKDLGVTWTEADFESYKAKTNTTFKNFDVAPDNPEKPGKKTVFADPLTVSELTLTQAEITAAINSLNWAWLPAENVQVRLSDGTVEISGNVKLDHIEDFVKFIGGVGYDSEDVAKAADWGRRFVDGGAFYAKGAASVSNNQLTLDLQQVQIGRFSAPIDIASTVVYTGGSNGINNVQNLDISSAKVEAGILKFSGTYPSTIYVKQ